MDFLDLKIFFSLIFLTIRVFHNAIILAMWSVSDYDVRHDFSYVYIFHLIVTWFHLPLSSEMKWIQSSLINFFCSIHHIRISDMWPALDFHLNVAGEGSETPSHQKLSRWRFISVLCWSFFHLLQTNNKSSNYTCSYEEKYLKFSQNIKKPNTSIKMRVWKNIKKIFIHGAMRALCVCLWDLGRKKKNELINFFLSHSKKVHVYIKNSL